MFFIRILTYIWRVWFYVVIAFAIILLFPFIFITSLSSKHYPTFFKLSRIWGWVVLVFTGFWPKVKWLQIPDKKGVYIICPNHTSEADIMMTLAIFPNCFMFIGKKELKMFPLFGYFYKRTNLLVDRKSLKSRKEVFKKAAQKIDEGISLCIYPEGRVPNEGLILGVFKNGAFKLAVEKQIPIIPVTFLDNKRHLPNDFSKGSPGILRTIVHEFIYPQEKTAREALKMKKICYETLKREIEKSSRGKIIK